MRKKDVRSKVNNRINLVKISNIPPSRHVHKINALFIFSLILMLALVFALGFMINKNLLKTTGFAVTTYPIITTVNGTYGGSVLKIIFPMNSSFFNLINLNNLNFTIETNYHGTNFTTTYDYGPNANPRIIVTPCNFLLRTSVLSVNDPGITFGSSVNLPYTSTLIKNYTNNLICNANARCPDGIYEVLASVENSCGDVPSIYSDPVFFTINLNPPVITSTSPSNGDNLTAYENGSAIIHPSLEAIDSTSINKTLKTQTQTIDLTTVQSPISLSVGSYTWNFSAIDRDGYINSSIVNFNVIPYVAPLNPVIQNFSYASGTPDDGQVVALGNFNISLLVADPSTVSKVEIFVYDSNFSLIKNITNNNKLSSYFMNVNSLSEGTYYFNATLTNDSNYKFSVPTRQLRISNSSILDNSFAGSLIFGQNTEVDSSIKNESSIEINITSNQSLNGKILIVNLYDQSGNVVRSDQTNLSFIDVVYDNLSNGVYFFNASLLDSNVVVTSTITRTVIINKGSNLALSDLPKLVSFYPKNNSNLSASEIIFTVKLNKAGSVLISFDHGATNYSMDSSDDVSFSFKYTPSLTDSSVTFYVGDDSGRFNTYNLNFNVLENSSFAKKIIYLVIIVAVVIIIILLIFLYFIMKNKKTDYPNDPNNFQPGSMPPRFPPNNFQTNQLNPGFNRPVQFRPRPSMNPNFIPRNNLNTSSAQN